MAIILFGLPAVCLDNLLAKDSYTCRLMKVICSRWFCSINYFNLFGIHDTRMRYICLLCNIFISSSQRFSRPGWHHLHGSTQGNAQCVKSRRGLFLTQGFHPKQQQPNLTNVKSHNMTKHTTQQPGHAHVIVIASKTYRYHEVHGNP